jgi:hypothetical protein
MGYKPHGKNLRNFPKLLFAKANTNIILDHHTCIENFHVPLQWNYEHFGEIEKI